MIDVMGRRNLFFAISAIVILVGLVFLATRGLNLGVDFTGGSLIRVRLDHPVTAAEVRDALVAPELADMHLEKAVIQPIEGTNDVQIRAHVQGKPLSDPQLKRVVDTLSARLGSASVIEAEMVEPVIGKELLSKAMMAVLLGWIGILIYVSVRFEYRFAVAGVAALIHDVLVILGMFAILGREVNSPFIAAVLTIVGYSINDTIVVFDKIRENLKFRKRETYEELVNKSITQTLGRSLNTSLTTLLPVIALYLFGGATIKDFSLALIIGLISGTYSSIFVASPIWLIWKNWERDRQRKFAVAKAR